MKKVFKKYFIPHAENNFYPHILHTKRAVFYSLFFLLCKAIIFFFVLALPAAVFTLPDVLSQEANKITALTNELRKQNKVSALSGNDRLAVAAAAKAADMVRKSYFSHSGSNGETVTDFVTKSGYRYSVVGENLAVGFASAKDVMAAWQKSTKHMANLVDKDYIDLGVSMQEGIYKGQSSVFAVQHFAKPASVSIGRIKSDSAIKSVVSQTDTKRVLSSISFNSTQTTKAVLSEKITAPVTDEEVLVGEPFWENPIQKYQHTKEIYPINNIFGFSRNLFLLAIIFFSIALALSVFVEFKKQHPHIIAQTSGLIGLLVVLFLV